MAFRDGVGIAVDLDDQLFGKAQHVGEERSKRRLMAPFQMRIGFAQRAEQAAFGLGSLAAQLAGARNRTDRLFLVKAHLPSPFRRYAAPSLSQRERDLGCPVKARLLTR